MDLSGLAVRSECLIDADHRRQLLLFDFNDDHPGFHHFTLNQQDFDIFSAGVLERLIRTFD